MARSKEGKHPSAGEAGKAYVPTRKWKVDPNKEAKIVELVEKLPNGLFAILANENARYTAFHGSCASLIMPKASRISFHTGCYVVDSHNRSVLGMNEDEDWIMFMGDDHVFEPMFLIKMLTKMYAHDLDILVPVCFKRSFPPKPVLYNWINEKEVAAIDLNEHPEGGIIEVYAAGTAGMVVRKRVFERMVENSMTPFFELGIGQWGEDLYFCHKAQQLGIKVHADLDSSLGHILNTAIWPVQSEGGGPWGCQYDFNTQGGFVLGI